MSQSRFFRRFLIVSLLTWMVIPWPLYGQTPAATPIAAKKFTFRALNSNVQAVVSELTKQTGLEVDLTGIDGKLPINAAFDNSDFWNVIDLIANQSKSRVVIGRRGKAVSLVKSTRLQAPVSVDGPFRIAAQAVDSRIDLLSGQRLYDLTLELAWEARLPVYRVDAHPTITNGKDDAGRAITVKPFDARNPVDGVSTVLRIPLDGLSRDSKQISVLQGSFRVTASDELLHFHFDHLTQSAVAKQKGVEVTLRKFAKEGTFWIADLELHYPKDSAVFESFETNWVGRNRMNLVAPNGVNKFAPSDEELNGTSLRYRFKEDNQKGFAPKDLKGWKMDYEAPGFLREILVNFELKGIALP